MSTNCSRAWKMILLCGLTSTLMLSGCRGAATATPVPLRTAASQPTVVISDECVSTMGMPVLYASGGDLWCSDLDGESTLQLTQGDALNLVAPAPPGGVSRALSDACQPNVSPDGRWIAYAPYSGWGSTMILLPTVEGMAPQTLDNTCYGVWSPDSTRLAYAPDLESPWNKEMEPSVYVYDLSTKSITIYYPNEGDETEWAGANTFLWAPDGDAVVFRGRTDETVEAEMPDSHKAKIFRIDLSSGESEVIGTVWVSVASSQTFCLDSRGGFTTNVDTGVICSKDYGYFTSPNGLRTYTMSPQSAGSSIRVLDAEGSVIWERELELDVGEAKVRWSADGEYLLIDDYDMTTPIWRLASDGSGELEPVVEKGYLLNVISAWAE